MENQRPLILISNDDGIRAKGISELIRALRPLGEIVVMAPDLPRSGAACALTTKEPVHYQLVRKDVGVTVYTCSGTPVDCVKMAFHTVLDRKPDLVVCGINHGDNSSVNVHYSGTMGGVIEGSLKGVDSVAFSLCNHEPDADFEPMLPYIRKIVEQVLKEGLPLLTCLNVNFPNVKEFKGVRVCKQAKGDWINEWESISYREGAHYFWLTGEFACSNPEDEQSDYWALANGYVAITPTTVDVTDYSIMEKLKSWFA